MCLQNCSLPQALPPLLPPLPLVRAGVRKQCRLLGKTAHQAFVKVRAMQLRLGRFAARQKEPKRRLAFLPLTPLFQALILKRRIESAGEDALLPHAGPRTSVS